MKDCVIIDKSVPQYKGNFHMHTARSWDSTVSVQDALCEYYDKGFQFCALTDHEVYWDSTEYDREDFLVLSGVESAFILGETQPDWLLERSKFKSLHINLLHDMTKGENGFLHDQVLKRPIDYGIDSWNQYIEYCKEKNQIVIINHPDWSRLDPEIMLGIQGAFAFEIWNSGAVNDCGGDTDEYRWDYCLSRGKRLWALTGDDTHKYGTDYRACGAAFTMVYTDSFTKEGLIQAMKQGHFYPSSGPKIYDMRVADDVLYMDFDPAAKVRIVGADYLAKGFVPAPGETICHIEWKIKENLKYFRVEIHSPDGKIAWSQPIFPGAWDRAAVALREDPHTPLPAEQIGWQ